MLRSLWMGSLLVLAALPHPAAAEEDPPLKEALALDAAFQQAIRRAEPSIACILVSRSDAYRRILGEPPLDDHPGKLGGLDRSALARLEPGEARRLDLADPAHVPESYGSGVVISDRGLILTNFHVVRDATKVYVRLPGGQGSYADIHAADSRSDLAVLRLLDRVVLPTKPLRLGDGGQVRKGQIVLTLANPFAAGFRDGSPSASWGIISNVRRRAPAPSEETDEEWERYQKTLHHYGTLLQIDTRLNLGCSGGAVINLQGELIGLTSALAAVTGRETPGGYAIPMDEAMKRIVHVLEQGREVEYGFLGVRPAPLAQGAPGVVARMVTPGGPAMNAGLRNGDVILSVGGTPLRDVEDLYLTVGTMLAGSEVQLDVAQPLTRARRTVTVRLAKFYLPADRCQAIVSNQGPAPRGLRVDYTSILIQRPTTMQAIPAGVVVREVLPGSPADTAKLQPDKIITHVGRVPVQTPEEFYREMERASGPVELTVLSGDRPESVRVEAK